MKILFKSKSTKIVITILLCIFSLFYLSTIAYSAFSSTMNITGIAHSRVEADVRITNFLLSEATSATSYYEEFSKNSIKTNISLNNETSSIIYNIEITNYGTNNVGIYDITGLPEELNYSIENYTLKDMICDETGKCNSLAKKNIKLKITSDNSTYQGDINLFFEFRPFYNITYKNFNNVYISSIIKSESIDIDLSKDSPRLVNVTSKTENIDYEYKNNILTLYNIDSNIEIEAINGIYTYDYTGTSQEFITEYDGLYKVELWGAQGGTTYGGYGGYTSGEIFLSKNSKFYLHVGEHQQRGDIDIAYNGGGSTEEDPGTATGDENRYGAGGGATDIRIESGTWNNSTGLKSRIMVAGAGGGGHISVPKNMYAYGGIGGGLIGGTGNKAQYGTPQYAYASAKGGTQTSGGAGGISELNGQPGMFGQGGSGVQYQAAGGSGYYGGGSSGVENAIASTGGGGSSFISGYDGCDAISSASTSSNIIHTGTSEHYSGYIFSEPVMKSGAETMPTYNSTSTKTGNKGNGYAKITMLELGNVYSITYTGITGNYQKTIKKGENLVVNFSTNAPKSIGVLFDKKTTSNYQYQNGIVTINNVTNNIEIVALPIEYTFDYTGNYQQFTPKYNGVYKVELWGAQSGGSLGKGAYTSGEITLQKNKSLYVYVGGTPTSTTGGWNGGGKGYIDATTAGGGATDIRLTSGTWSNFNSLKSRIMVASGGGGDSFGGYGAPGGVINGINGIPIENGSYKGIYTYGYGGSQTAGGSAGNFDWGGTGPTAGSFGKGGTGNSDYGGGGGAGYYGGGGSGVASDSRGGAGSGSSFISGHSGCNAISSSSTSSSISHTGTPNHYSGYVFTNTKMIAGNQEMPTHDATSTMTGNTGNGYAKITLLN